VPSIANGYELRVIDVRNVRGFEVIRVAIQSNGAIFSSGVDVQEW